MKKAIKRMFGSGLPKLAALALAALASGGAWATAKPIAVWNADFVDGAERGGYVFNRNGNTVESDGTITIKSSSNGSSGGVTLLKSSHTARPMTVVAAFEDLSIAGSTHDIALATSKVLYNGTSTYFNRTGLSLRQSDSKFYGWWNNTTGDSEKGSIYTNTDATFRNAAFDSATRHYIAYCYTSGVYGYDNRNEVYYRSGLTSGYDSGLYGFAVGGLSNSADYNAENATVKYIAILNSNSSSDISAWSLTGMTAAETVANNGTITGGSNVGVNLLTEDMTVNLSSATSAAAVFVQTNATIVVTGSGSLNIGGGSGPLYIADGATLTIDASGLTLSADNPSVTLVSGKVFGTSLVSVTCPQLGGVDVATASVTENGITLSYTPGFSYKSGGTPSGWSTSWGGETFETYYRPGPSASQPAVFEVKAGKHPYSGMSAKTSAFSYAVYADVSQMTSSKGVITAFGKKANMLVIYRDGSNVKAGRYQSTAFDSDWAAAVAMPSAGFHLYTVTYDPSTGVLHLYLDDGIVSSTNEGSSDLLCDHEDTAGNLASGFQIGSVHSGMSGTGFNVGIGMAFASAVGFDRVLSASDVAELSTVYPAMNGTISWNVTVPGTDTAYLTFTPGYSVSSSGVTLDGGSGTRTLVLPDSLALTAVTVENFDEIKIPADGTLTLNAGTTVASGTTIKGDGSSGTETIVLNDDFDFTGVTLQDIDAIQVAAGKALTLTAGAEDDVGGISLGDGAKLILVVASEDVYNYYGHISYMTLSKGDGATLEYGYMSSGVYTAINDPDAINGNNLLPYYYVFDVDDGASGGAVNTDANWRGGSVPPSTGRNAAFHVDSDSAEGITVTVDADIAFGDIQVYGSGVITFVGSGGCKLSCANLDVASGVTVKIDGTSDSEALNVSGGTIVGDGTITVLSGAKMVLDGVTSANIFTVNGTLETSGTTTLSGANTSAAGSLIEVVSDTTTLSSAFQGIGGNITIDAGAALTLGASLNGSKVDQLYNHINPNGSTILDISGTLNVGVYMLEFGSNIQVLLRTNARVTANTNVTGNNSALGYGHWAWLDSGMGLHAYGNAELALFIRTPSGVSPVFNIEEGATLVISQPFVSQTSIRNGGGSITKAGAGTLDLTAISPTKPITINAGKVVADEVPTATMDIGSSGTFTLKNRAWTSSPDVFTGTGTLELWADTTKTEHTVTGVTFGGKVIVKNTGDIQNNFKQSGAAMFSSEPEFRLDSTQTHLGGGYYDNNESHPFVVKDLTGSGVFKSEWNGTSEHSYVVKAVQTKDTVYDGTFTSSYSNNSKKRIMNLTVVGDGSGTVHSLTLSAAQNTSNTDVAQAESTLTVGDGAKVVFTSGGGWQYGNVVVDQGGWLESTNTATAVTQLRLYGGSNLVLPSTSHVLSGITNVTGSGEIKVHIADGSVPSVDDYLVSWSVSSAPSGKYLLAGASATTLALEADTSGLKVVACQATLTRANGEQLGYANLSDAVNAFVQLALGGELDAYITISAGVEPIESQLSFWAASGIRYDSDNRKLYTAVVAQIGARQYPLLALAVEDAADNATVTLVSDSEEANVALNNKTIAFVEGDGATFTGSFSGTGTLVLDGAGLKSPDSARWAAGWTGTVWLKNLSSYTLVPGNYGNADSVIKFTGVTAIIASGETFGPAVELEDDGAMKALTLDCTTAYSQNTVTFNEIRGTGTLVTSSSNNQYPRTNFKVLAWSGFTGSLDIDRGRVIFGTDTPSADTWRYVYVSSGAAVDVASGKTWKATEGFVVNGSLTCDGGELHGVAGDSPTLKLGGSGVLTNSFVGGGAQCFNAGAITVSDSLSVVLLGGWSNFGTWTLNGTSSLGFDPGSDDNIWIYNSTTESSPITSAGQNTTVHIYGNGVNKVVDNVQDGTKDAKIHVHNRGTFQVSNAAADNDRLMYDDPGNVGGITVDAGGLIVFKSRETYTRNTTLNGGTFRLDGLNSDRSLDLFKTVEFTVTDNSTIEAAGASHWIYLRGGTPTFNVSADKTLTMNAGFTYAGESKQNMIKAGAGTMVVNGYVSGGAHESFSQPKGVTINAGTYELNAVQTSNGQTGDAANFYTVASGAKLKVGATGQVNTTTLTLNDGSLLEFGASSTLINTTNVTFASGTTTVSFSTGVTPTSGTKLIDWSAAPNGSFNSSVVIGDVTYYLNKKSDGLYVYSAATYNGTDYDTVQAAIDAMTTAGGALGDITVNSADAVIPSGYALVTDATTGAMTIRAAGTVYYKTGYWGTASDSTFVVEMSDNSATTLLPGDTVVVDSTHCSASSAWAAPALPQTVARVVINKNFTFYPGSDQLATLNGISFTIDDSVTLTFQRNSRNMIVGPMSLTGGTVALDNNSGTLTVAGALTGTSEIAVGTGKTVTMASGGSLGSTLTLTGSGEIVLATLSGLDADMDSGWTGTAILPSSQTFSDFIFDDYGVAGSTVRVQGTNTGTLDYNTSHGAAVATTVEIPSGASLTVTGFDSSYANTFNVLKGEGTFAVNISDSIDLSDSGDSAYFLLKDVSNFTGALTATGAGIAIGATKPGNTVAGGKIIVVSGGTATVPSGKTWSAASGFEVGGTLTVAGTISGEVVMTEGGELVLGATGYTGAGNTITVTGNAAITATAATMPINVSAISTGKTLTVTGGQVAIGTNRPVGTIAFADGAGLGTSAISAQFASATESEITVNVSGDLTVANVTALKPDGSAETSATASIANGVLTIALSETVIPVNVDYIAYGDLGVPASGTAILTTDHPVMITVTTYEELTALTSRDVTITLNPTGTGAFTFVFNSFVAPEYMRPNLKLSGEYEIMYDLGLFDDPSLAAPMSLFSSASFTNSSEVVKECTGQLNISGSARIRTCADMTFSNVANSFASTASLEVANGTATFAFASAGAPTSVAIADGATLAISSTALTADMDISGTGTLKILDDLVVSGVGNTISGGIVFEDEATLAFANGASLTLDGNLTAGDGLTIAPSAMAERTVTLVTAASVPSSLTLSAPSDTGVTYSLSSDATTITLTRTPILAFIYDAVPNAEPYGWGIREWCNSTYPQYFRSNLRVGPLPAMPVVYEVTSEDRPWASISAKSAAFTFAAYVDVSQVSTSGKQIIASFGNNSHDMVILYREDTNVKAAYVRSGGSVYGTAASVAVMPGYHLYTIACDPTGSTPSLTLYKDTALVETVYASGSVTLGVGISLGSVYQNPPGAFSIGVGAAFATVCGYDTALNVADVGELAISFPATDGTVIPGDVDNKIDAYTISGTVINIYGTMSATNDLYIGVSGSATLNIPSGTTISVPQIRVPNTKNSYPTVNIDGIVNVTSTSTTYNVYSEINQFKGIMFGYWNTSGSGTYNIGATGVLNGTNAWLQTVRDSGGTQTINVNGGQLKVKGLYSYKANTSIVNLDDDGTVQIAETTTDGGVITYNLTNGTFRTMDTLTVSAANKMNMQFSGTTDTPTILDPHGNTMTISADAFFGRGYITVRDSSETKDGVVIFPELPSSGDKFNGYLILDDASATNMNLSAFNGRVVVRGGAKGTLERLVGFPGTAKFDTAGTYDARGVDLTGVSIEVTAPGVYLQASAGQEGTVLVYNNGELDLYVTNEQFKNLGYVFHGAIQLDFNGNPIGTLRYFHAEDGSTGSGPYVAGDALTAAELAVVKAGFNLVPYYRIFSGDYSTLNDGEYTGSLKTLEHWDYYDSFEGDKAPTNGNMGIKVQGGNTLRIEIDCDATFGEVQVFGSGKVIFTKPGEYVMAVTNGLYATSGTEYYIAGGIAEGVSLWALDNGTVAQVDCGTEEDPFDVTYANGPGTVSVGEGAYANFTRSGVDYMTVKGTANVSGDVFFVDASLTVESTGTLNFNSATINSSYLFLTVDEGGVVNLNGSTSLSVWNLSVNGTVNVASSAALQTAPVGTGRVAYTGKKPDGVADNWWTTGTASAGWRGTLAVCDYTAPSESWNTSQYGTQYSTLEFSGCDIKDFSGNVNNGPKLRLEGSGLKIQNGYSNQSTKFPSLSGSGALVPLLAPRQVYLFGSGEDFTGSITNTGRIIVFDSAMNHSPTQDETGDRSITIYENTTASLGDGAVWQTPRMTTIKGTLNVLGTGTLDSPVELIAGAQINLTNVALRVTGSLSLPATGIVRIHPGIISLEDPYGEGVPLITGISSPSEELANGNILGNVSVIGATTTSFVCAKTNALDNTKRDIVVYKRLPIDGDGDTSVKVPIDWMLRKAISAISAETNIADIENVIRTNVNVNGCTYLESYALNLDPSDANAVPVAGMTVNDDNFELYITNAIPAGVTLTLRAGTTTPSSEEGEDYVKDGAGDDITATITGNDTAERARAARVVIPIPSYDPEDPEADPVNLYRLKVGISGTDTP